MTQLNKYASTGDKWNNREQIQLDIIRLSDGRIDRLPELVKAAKSDFRDIMMNAEAPNYEEYVSANVKKGQSIAPLNPEDLELRRALDADLRQFVLWLIQHVK